MSSNRERVLNVLESLPEVEIEVGGERDQHVGASVRSKRFAWYLDDHHGDGTVSVTCKAPTGVNESMVKADPQRYFVPSYTGPRGWVGARLDVDDVDWDRVELLIIEAYRMTAPKSLVARHSPD
ncbi:MAG: MmcQ/YjbR family DNA-binding protein [Acidimicrobiales bacterium]